jgi:hypothetical protein
MLQTVQAPQSEFPLDFPYMADFNDLNQETTGHNSVKSKEYLDRGDMSLKCISREIV